MKISKWKTYLALWPRSMIFLCNETGHNNQMARQQQQQKQKNRKKERENQKRVQLEGE